MIDTDKYEGHSTEYSYEIISVDDDKDMYATLNLLADAPFLLEEVKQIHEILREAFSTEAKHSGAEYLNMIAKITGLIE